MIKAIHQAVPLLTIIQLWCAAASSCITRHHLLPEPGSRVHGQASGQCWGCPEFASLPYLLSDSMVEQLHMWLAHACGINANILN